MNAVPRVASALIVATALFACSSGRPRDRLANQNPRSEFPMTVPGAPSPAGATAPPAPERADGGAEKARVALEPVRVLASVVSRAVATDEDHVYFGDLGDDGLFALAKRGGGEPVRIARRAPVRGALTVDRAQIVWIASPGDLVLRVPTSGGATTTLRDRGLFTDVAADGADVVFTEAASGGGGVLRVTGATAARIATLDASPRGVALGDADAFVVAGDKLLRVPRARGAVSVLAEAPSMASPVAAGDRVYVVAAGEGGEHVVLGVPRTGGRAAKVAARVHVRSPLAVHEGILYVIDGDRARLRAVTLATGADRVIAEHEALASAVALAADDDGVVVATDEANVLLGVGRIGVAPVAGSPKRSTSDPPDGGGSGSAPP